MTRNRTRASAIALATSLTFFYGMVAIADANDWSRHAHAAIAAVTLVIMVGARLWFVGPAERGRLRAALRRRGPALWARLRRRSRLRA